MKKIVFLFGIFFICCTQLFAESDLINVFQLAIVNDPIYQQSISESLIYCEDVGINRASLLPNLSFKARPQQDKLHFTGSAVRTQILPPANDVRSLDMKLTLSQPIFNFAQWSHLKSATIIARQANAQLNASLQDLMLRVAKAYFTILLDEENLDYNRANKETLEKQLFQAKKLLKVGSTTKIDLYTAESAYGTAKSDYTMAETQLATDRLFLSTITGVEIEGLARLNDHFPIITPQPCDIQAWSMKSKEQNWTIRANIFSVEAAKEAIKEQFAGHFPTLDAQVTYDVFTNNSTASSILYSAGATKARDLNGFLSLNVPIFSGGAVVSQTNRAKYQYKLALQKLEASIRDTLFTAQQSYLMIMATTQKMDEDKITIKSATSSLKGLQERYKIGEATLIDVLNQQDKLFKAQLQYAIDRKNYIINLLTLKKAAGILSAHDLETINQWLDCNSSV